ncbi:hypothetical protein GJ496_000790 [Pomphorhynchus laevis]|nr:hypothetical protein GJ496_000790 [Pomphorhynchus laevis]
MQIGALKQLNAYLIIANLGVDLNEEKCQHTRVDVKAFSFRKRSDKSSDIASFSIPLDIKQTSSTKLPSSTSSIQLLKEE